MYWFAIGLVHNGMASLPSPILWAGRFPSSMSGHYVERLRCHLREFRHEGETFRGLDRFHLTDSNQKCSEEIP